MAEGPTLPDGVDPHVQSFVACLRDQLELAAGKVTWLPMPPGVPRFLGKPQARFAPDGAAVRATVKWGFASIGLRASIEDGLLVAETTGFAYGLDGAIERWIASMNEQLRAHHRRLDRIVLVGDDVVIYKRHAASVAEGDGHVETRQAGAVVSD
jgi:hypothetical protein